eukprot:2795047-Amphidinium_carterae.1
MQNFNFGGQTTQTYTTNIALLLEQRQAALQCSSSSKFNVKKLSQKCSLLVQNYKVSNTCPAHYSYSRAHTQARDDFNVIIMVAMASHVTKHTLPN